MSEPIRGVKEALACVLEDPTRESFRNLLRDHTGEHPNLDFKATWPELDKVARHVLAFANSGGGCIVFGVNERDDKTLDPAGLESMVDKAEVTRVLANTVPEPVFDAVRLDDFSYEASDYGKLAGKKFQLIIVDFKSELLPFVCEKQSTSTRPGAVYVRRGTESVEANHAEMQKLINQRLETGHSTAAAMKLDDHFEQLRVLEKQIPRTIISIPDLNAAFSSLGNINRFLGREPKPNPKFPPEDTESFARRMFEAKKVLIAREVGVDPKPSKR